MRRLSDLVKKAIERSKDGEDISPKSTSCVDQTNPSTSSALRPDTEPPERYESMDRPPLADSSGVHIRGSSRSTPRNVTRSVLRKFRENRFQEDIAGKDSASFDPSSFSKPQGNVDLGLNPRQEQSFRVDMRQSGLSRSGITTLGRQQPGPQPDSQTPISSEEPDATRMVPLHLIITKLHKPKPAGTCTEEEAAEIPRTKATKTRSRRTNMRKPRQYTKQREEVDVEGDEMIERVMKMDPAYEQCTEFGKKLARMLLKKKRV